MTTYMYSEFDKSKNIIQPQMQRFRQIYRGYRNSEKENLEQDQFLQDVSKLQKRIVNAENIIKTMTSTFYYHDAATPITPSATPFFLAEIGHYGHNIVTLTIEDTLELSSQIFRLSKKIKRLENQES